MKLYEENINMQEALVRESKNSAQAPATTPKNPKIPLFVGGGAKADPPPVQKTEENSKDAAEKAA